MGELKTIHVDREGLREVCQKFNLKLAILFGSYASGKFIKEKSDIDIGILCKGRNHIIENDLFLIQEFIKLFNNDRVNLTYLNYADPLLLFEVAKNGVLLYQDRRDRFAEFKITAIKKHLDARKFYILEDLCLEKFMQKRTGKL